MPKMVIRCSLLWVPILLLAVATRAGAQNPPAGKFSPRFLQQAEALRSKLDLWQKTLNRFDFEQLKMGKDGPAILDKLKDDRSVCSHLIQRLDRQISLLENLAEKFPTLDHLNQEVTIMWEVVGLENWVIKLTSDLDLAYSSGTASGLARFDDPRSVHLQEWLSELREIASNGSPADLGYFHALLENALMMHVGAVESELSQCRARKPEDAEQKPVARRGKTPPQPRARTSIGSSPARVIGSPPAGAALY